MKNILLVDDHAYILEVLALTFATTAPGCAILKATNGKEAVDILQGVPVDLVLTDINMPVMDGYGLIKHKNRICPSVPLLVMTGDASPEVMKKLNSLGVTECLEKPFNVDAVAGLILKTLDAPPHAPGRQPVAAAQYLTS